MQIKKLVVDAKELKTSYTKFADIVIKQLIYCVILLAIATGVTINTFGQLGIIQHHNIFAFSLESMIGMIVVCCPCSIGLTSALVSIQTQAKLNSKGIILKNDYTIENVNNQDTVVFDKTGTLVENKLNVIDFYYQPNTNSKITENGIKSILYSITKNTNHPVALGVAAAFRAIFIPTTYIVSKTEVEGLGMEGLLLFNDIKQSFKVGSLDFVNNINISLNNIKLSKQSEIPFSLMQQNIEGEVSGVVILSNSIKKEAIQIIKYLQSKNKDVQMFTGDTEECASYVAKTLDIKNYRSKLLPSQKQIELKNMRDNSNKKVIQIGDGFNDTQAIAEAFIGVAIDSKNLITCTSADVVIIGSSINNLIQMIDLCEFSFSIIKQNYFWALIQNCCCIPLAGGWFQFAFNVRLTPNLSALAMIISSFCVIVNSSRVAFTKITKYPNKNNKIGQENNETILISIDYKDTDNLIAMKNNTFETIN